LEGNVEKKKCVDKVINISSGRFIIYINIIYHFTDIYENKYNLLNLIHLI